MQIIIERDGYTDVVSGVYEKWGNFSSFSLVDFLLIAQWGENFSIYFGKFEQTKNLVLTWTQINQE